MRDHRWLTEQLQYLLSKYFADVAITNPIEIKFGREAKYRFGSIKLEKRKNFKFKISNFQFPMKKEKSAPARSIITVTSMFRDEEIPEDVVWYTIAHELCHYAHGFSSTNKRLFRHPHHGGVVNKELARRGAEHLVRAFGVWLKDYRKEIMAGKVKV